MLADPRVDKALASLLYDEDINFRHPEGVTAIVEALARRPNPELIVPLYADILRLQPAEIGQGIARTVLSQFNPDVILERFREAGLEQQLKRVLPSTEPRKRNVVIVGIDGFNVLYTHGGEVKQRALDILEGEFGTGRTGGVQFWHYGAQPGNFDQLLDDLADAVRRQPDTRFVVNASLGDLNMERVQGVFDAAKVEALGRHGVVFVVAAGNERSLRPPFPQYDNVLPVAAGETAQTERRGPEYQKTDYSSYGPEVFVTAASGTSKGASFAAPVVAAKLAAEFIRQPSELARDIIERVRLQARPMPNDPFYQKGLLGAGFLEVREPVRRK